MSNTYNLNINAGADYKLGVTYSNTDLTGYAIRSQFRKKTDSAGFDLELTDGNGGFVFTDAANGGFQMVISNAQTSALSGSYVYDIEIVSAGGEVTRVLCGHVEVSAEVTR